MAQLEKNIPEVSSRIPLVHRLTAIPGLRWILVIVPLFYLVILLYYSIIGILKLSFFDETGFTLKYLHGAFTDPIYLRVLWTTVKTALFVTVTTLLIGYPIAYLLTILRSHKWKRLILGLVIITLWISLLARTFSWVIVLQKHGVINNFLMNIGVINQPLDLLYSFPAVVIGMSHILLPFMILNLYPVMEGIDLQLMQAAQSLGSRPWKAFKQIFLPLSLPGVIAGSLIVFINSLGYFITPALLGGSGNTMLSEFIEININTTFNWHLAAALSFLLLVATFLLLFIAFLFTRSSAVLKGGK
jgi:ABC-type spermidine/putrescine transport system permease subunit I